MPLTLPSHLAQFTVQEIQFELMRRTKNDAYRAYANELVALMLQHADLWEAIIQTGQFYFFNHDALPSLRYPLMPQLRFVLDNDWPADMIYVLTETEERRDALLKLWEGKVWPDSIMHNYDAEECKKMLESCGLPDTYRISYYWED